MCVLPLLIGWLLDWLLGDPLWLPHPVVGFGKAIAFADQKLNLGSHRKLRGGIVAIVLTASVFAVTFTLNLLIGSWNVIAAIAFQTIIIFYCLAGTTLVR